jgi:amidase
MMIRRILQLLSVPCALAAALPVAGQHHIPLSDATILEIQSAVDSGSLSYEQLVSMFVARIDAYDKQGPSLNAVIHINPLALETARQLDEERRIHGRRSLLHGIPIVLKDNFDTFDMPTTGGSLVFKDNAPDYDATSVNKLRAAGAIVFAKVNMSGFMGTRVGTGDSAVGGQTLNPYNTAHHPGGSSGGTGVAVAAWFAMAGLGTETGVSIRDPSANNAVVGIAPTEGLVSRAGVLPISFVHDRVGPMARSVSDAAAVLSVIAGIDADDIYTLKSAGKIPPAGYTSFLDKHGLKGARIGVLKDLFNSGPEHDESLAIVASAISALEAEGAHLIHDLTLGTNLRSILRWSRSSSIENRFALDSYFKRRGSSSPVKSFEEYIELGFYYEHAKPGLLRSLAVESLDTHPTFASLMANRQNLRDLTEALMEKYQLDALVYPMKTYPAAKIPKEGTPGELRPRDADNPFSSITGLPAIVVPAGFDSNGLPVAIEFLGRQFSEGTLIKVAYAYEQATQHRIPPTTTPPLPGEVIVIK